MDEEVKCPKCPKMMVMTKITDHVSHQHYNKLDFICNLCTQTFRKSVQFRKHIRDEHPENSNDGLVKLLVLKPTTDEADFIDLGQFGFTFTNDSNGSSNESENIDDSGMEISQSDTYNSTLSNSQALCENCGHTIKMEENHNCPAEIIPSKLVCENAGNIDAVSSKSVKVKSKQSVKRKIVQQEIHHPPAVRRAAQLSQPRTQPDTLEFIKKVRKKIESNQDIDVEKMIEYAGPTARLPPKRSEKILTPVIASEVSVKGIVGLDFIRRQREVKTWAKDMTDKKTIHKPNQNQIVQKRQINRKSIPKPCPNSKIIFCQNTSTTTVLKPITGPSIQIGMKDNINKFIVNIVDKIKHDAAEKAKLENLVTAKNLAELEKAEVKHEAKLEDDRRKQMAIIKQRRLFAAIQVVKKSKKFQCPDCLLDFHNDLKSFFRHLKTDHTTFANYDHYEGAYEVIDSESSEESEEDEETEIVELEENVEFKSNRIIPADHVMSASSVEIEDPPIDQTTFCNVCKVKLMARGYKRHVTEMHHDGTHKCKICKGVFVRAKQLESHTRKIHREEYFNPPPCEICGKKYANMTNMNIHTRNSSCSKKLKSVLSPSWQNAMNGRKPKMNLTAEDKEQIIEYVTNKRNEDAEISYSKITEGITEMLGKPVQTQRTGTVADMTEDVDSIRLVRDQFQHVEMLGEDVVALRNHVLSLSQQKDLARQGWRALKKRTNEKPVWLNIGTFVEFDPAEAEKMLEAEMKDLAAEITTQRDLLRRAAAKVDEAIGMNKMQGMNLNPVSSTEIKDILKKTDPSKV